MTTRKNPFHFATTRTRRPRRSRLEGWRELIPLPPWLRAIPPPPNCNRTKFRPPRRSYLEPTRDLTPPTLSIEEKQKEKPWVRKIRNRAHALRLRPRIAPGFQGGPVAGGRPCSSLHAGLIPIRAAITHPASLRE